MNNNTVNLPHLCQQVQNLVLQVAQFIREQAGQVRQQDIETKQRNHLVSYVDKTSEKMLIEGLQPLLPTAGFVAEEGTVAQTHNDWQWVIDPLDGTTNFLYQIPSYAISVGLMYKNKVVLGVVCEINRNELFYAWQNGGAYLNGKPIKVNPNSRFDTAFFGTGFPYYDYAVIEPYLQVLKHLMLHTNGARRLGAAAVDLCYVACGRFDGFFEHSLSIWDVAAGSLIITEAGGQVSDFNGQDNYLSGRQIVAASPSIWGEFFGLVNEHLGS